MARLKAGSMLTAEEYFANVVDKHNNKDYIKVNLASEKFKKLEKSYLRDIRYEPINEELEDTLRNYVEENPCDNNIR